VGSDPKRIENAHVSIDLETVDIEPEEGHELLKMLVVPRPIAWITTLRSDGIVNLAPFASYTMLGFGPMMIGIGFARAGGVRKKDTLRNIEHSREFVVHSVTEDLLPQVVETARSAPPGVSKARDTGLTLVPSTGVRVPRIAECAASLECVCEDISKIGATHDLVTARVVAVHLDESMFRDGEPNYERFRPVGRLHDEYFATLGEIIYLPRKSTATADSGSTSA
jgi:flavin reductase (DIM6/NTAB) family NADH-FMN oxidoreductase RutF